MCRAEGYVKKKKIKLWLFLPDIMIHDHDVVTFVGVFTKKTCFIYSYLESKIFSPGHLCSDEWWAFFTIVWHFTSGWLINSVIKNIIKCSLVHMCWHLDHYSYFATCLGGSEASFQQGHFSSHEVATTKINTSVIPQVLILFCVPSPRSQRSAIDQFY